MGEKNGNLDVRKASGISKHCTFCIMGQQLFESGKPKLKEWGLEKSSLNEAIIFN